LYRGQALKKRIKIKNQRQEKLARRECRRERQENVFKKGRTFRKCPPPQILVTGLTYSLTYIRKIWDLATLYTRWKFFYVQ